MTINQLKLALKKIQIIELIQTSRQLLKVIPYVKKLNCTW